MSEPTKDEIDAVQLRTRLQGLNASVFFKTVTSAELEILHKEELDPVFAEHLAAAAAKVREREEAEDRFRADAQVELKSHNDNSAT